MDHMHRTDMSWPAAVASGAALLGVGGLVGLQSGKKLQSSEDLKQLRKYEKWLLEKIKTNPDYLKTNKDYMLDPIFNDLEGKKSLDLYIKQDTEAKV